MHDNDGILNAYKGMLTEGKEQLNELFDTEVKAKVNLSTNDRIGISIAIGTIYMRLWANYKSDGVWELSYEKEPFETTYTTKKHGVIDTILDAIFTFMMSDQIDQWKEDEDSHIRWRSELGGVVPDDKIGYYTDTHRKQLHGAMVPVVSAIVKAVDIFFDEMGRDAGLVSLEIPVPDAGRSNNLDRFTDKVVTKFERKLSSKYNITKTRNLVTVELV